MINRFIFILILLMLPRQKYKFDNGICIKFNVRDENNIPVRDAKISIRPYKCRNIRNTSTCCRGIACIRGLYKNAYKVTISKVGYITKTFIIKVYKNMSCNITFNHKKITRIYGYIVDTHKRPINRASVILFRVISKGVYVPKRFTYTDYRGQYNFFNVPKGIYIVKAIK